ncbi:ABC transporter ATP-binding protein [Hydrogenophaga sp.]|uniref:ABC transporter ATP-binding protein n=1 Tax=Hydrogenophaga sp. TaxID=1904254 RepID=UPI00271DE5DA|nr:ABC transporter ATP-binding protein [Hydrogenophaga sp.]MDO9434662.1 ABC transporter ATP-binding protein [Hydrogenophaga sp.]
MTSPLPTRLAAFLWHFIKQQPISFTLFFIAPLSMVLEANVIPYALKQGIDVLSGDGVDRATVFQRLAPALWLGGIAWVSVCVIHRLINGWQSHFIPQFEARIRMSVLQHAMQHSHAYFADQQAGKLANKIADLPRALERIVMTVSWPGISTLAIVITTLVLLAQVGAVFAVVLGVWVAAHLTVTLHLSWLVQRSALVNAEDKSALSGSIVDTLANITSVRLFARRAHEMNWIGRQQATEVASHARLISRTNLLRWFGDIAFLVMQFSIVYFLVVRWQSHAISTGDVVYVFNMAFAVVVQMWFLGQALTDLFREIGIAQQALSLVSTMPQVPDAPNARTLRVGEGRIVLEQVGFHYRQGQSIFDNKSLTIEPGQKVGLVGFSGSGKTTLAHLILRFYDVEAGRILIDGQDIAKVTQDSLRESIAMIPQDASLFHRTLMENIRFARLDATDEEVLAAARHAHCDEFIGRLPDGYNSLVGERGTKLSGGQRQRIAIARAFLKDAPILILDEATSALDSVTEKHIQAGLHDLMQGRTAIVIAHRLSTLSEMDRILVFDKGHVVEDGPHEVLLKQGGHYARMWRMQAGGFLPEQTETEDADGPSD